MSAPAQVDGFTPVLTPIRVLEFQRKPWRKLVGYATVLAGDLKLVGCPVFRVNGRLRATLPSRPLFGPDGRHFVNPTTGRHKYEAVVLWRNKAAADAFSDIVVSALTAEYPRGSVVTA